MVLNFGSMGESFEELYGNANTWAQTHNWLEFGEVDPRHRRFWKSSLNGPLARPGLRTTAPEVFYIEFIFDELTAAYAEQSGLRMLSSPCVCAFSVVAGILSPSSCPVLWFKPSEDVYVTWGTYEPNVLELWFKLLLPIWLVAFWSSQLLVSRSPSIKMSVVPRSRVLRTWAQKCKSWRGR